MRNASTKTSRLIATAMGVGLFALANIAAAAPTTPAAAAPQPTASQDSGMRAYVDPKTGKLRQPTAEERQAEARASSQAATAKPPQMLYKQEANGAVRALDVTGALMETAVATQNADGSWTVSYVEGDATSVTPAAPVQTLEEK